MNLSFQLLITVFILIASISYLHSFKISSKTSLQLFFLENL